MLSGLLLGLGVLGLGLGAVLTPLVLLRMMPLMSEAELARFARVSRRGGAVAAASFIPLLLRAALTLDSAHLITTAGFAAAGFVVPVLLFRAVPCRLGPGLKAPYQRLVQTSAFAILPGRARDAAARDGALSLAAPDSGGGLSVADAPGRLSVPVEAPRRDEG